MGCGRSQLIGSQESLFFYKWFNTLCPPPLPTSASRFGEIFCNFLRRLVFALIMWFGIILGLINNVLLNMDERSKCPRSVFFSQYINAFFIRIREQSPSLNIASYPLLLFFFIFMHPKTEVKIACRWRVAGSRNRILYAYIKRAPGLNLWMFCFVICLCFVIVVYSTILKLVGFGRACAPVRCAHPSFWLIDTQKGALRAPPPPRPSQLRCSCLHHTLCTKSSPVSIILDQRGAKGSIVNYMDYHSLCAVVWFGSPHCLSRGNGPPLCLSVPCLYSSPTPTCVGGGWVFPNHTTAQKLWYSILYTILTLRARLWNIISPPLPSQLRWSLRGN